MAGVPVLAAVSAPSSLAVELAVETGMTLVGFLRGTSMNVYAGAERVVDAQIDRPRDAASTLTTPCLRAPPPQRIRRPVSAHE